MQPIKVLIVDDAVVVRNTISIALGSDPSFEVVGVASNGSNAIERIAELKPGLVTLDIGMPELDGRPTLEVIRKNWPNLPVIVFSTAAEYGAALRRSALRSKIVDFVDKPADVGSAHVATQRVRNELIPKAKRLVRLAATMRTNRTPHKRTLTAINSVHEQVSARPTVDVVAIGASTGGPEALADVLSRLPADFPAAILIVQHLPPMCVSHLAKRLDSISKISVLEAVDGTALQPGRALIAPGDFHMELVRHRGSVRVRLNQNPLENLFRPAVDALFHSVAQLYGRRAIGVVLTGIGKDGLRGSEALIKRRAAVIAQDEATSVVWGMPGHIVRAGLADRIVPLPGLAAELVRRCARSRRSLDPNTATF